MNDFWGALIVIGAGFFVAAAAYYRVMNPSIMTLGTGPIRIACVGDSITYGMGVLGRRRKWSYPGCLIRLLGNQYTVINYGLSDRSLLSSSDKPYFSEKIGKAAWNSDADILLLMLGSNDSKRINWAPAQFRSELRETLQHYQQKDIKDLFILIPPKVFTKHPGKTSCNEQILRDELRPVVYAVAQECGVPCIDLYAVTREHREWFPDTIHPNSAGNLAIAKKIMDTLKDSGALS